MQRPLRFAARLLPALLAVVLIAELVALTLSLARPDVPFLTELARISMFLQWLGLTSAGLLCYSRRWLARLTVLRFRSVPCCTYGFHRTSLAG